LHHLDTLDQRKEKNDFDSCSGRFDGLKQQKYTKKQKGNTPVACILRCSAAWPAGKAQKNRLK